MTTRIHCQVCDATNDANLCRNCTKRLADILRQLPGLLTDLQISASRQARVGNAQRVVRVPAEFAIADAAQAAIPARLRSLHGRITLPATAMPVDLDATQLHRQAAAGIRSWIGHLEARGVDAPRPIGRRTLTVHRNRAVWRHELISVPSIIELATWLHGQVDELRQLDRAGDIAIAAADLLAAIELAIDRRPPVEFAGRCTALSVKVVHVPMAGAPCSGLICAHETCGLIRSRYALQSYRPGPCGAELVHPEGETTVTCDDCGTIHHVATQRAKVAEQIADRLGSIREVAGFLRSLELDVTVDKIDGWLRRGRIVDYGTGPNGRLVRVGEVRAYAEQLADRKRERMAS